jgi:hypothetical protein
MSVRAMNTLAHGNLSGSDTSCSSQGHPLQRILIGQLAACRRPSSRRSTPITAWGRLWLSSELWTANGLEQRGEGNRGPAMQNISSTPLRMPGGLRATAPTPPRSLHDWPS